MTHLPQPPVAVVGAPCMHVGSGGMERCVAAGAGSTMGGLRLAWACSRRGHPDVRALVLPIGQRNPKFAFKLSMFFILKKHHN
jgi:hypothetical protein